MCKTIVRTSMQLQVSFSWFLWPHLRNSAHVFGCLLCMAKNNLPKRLVTLPEKEGERTEGTHNKQEIGGRSLTRPFSAKNKRWSISYLSDPSILLLGLFF